MRRLASHFPLQICITPAGTLQGFGTDSPLMTLLRVLLLRKLHLRDRTCVNSGSLRRGFTVQEMYWEKHLRMKKSKFQLGEFWSKVAKTESGTGVDRPPRAFSMSFVKERDQNVARLLPEPHGNMEQRGNSHCRGRDTQFTPAYQTSQLRVFYKFQHAGN